MPIVNASVPTPCPERLAAQAAYRAGRLGEAATICQQSIDIVYARNEYNESWRLRIVLSQCLCYLGDFPGAIAALEPLPTSDEISVGICAGVLNQQGFALSKSAQFASARVALDRALDLATAVPHPESNKLRAEIALSFTTLFFYLAKYDEVERHARIALEVGEQQGFPMIEASACAGRGKSAMYTNRQAEAIQWFERAMNIYLREGVTAYADIMRSEIGCCHFALGHDDEAEPYFIHCLKASREAGAWASVHIDLANMGALHLRRGEYAAALSHFQEALDIARRLGDKISAAKWLHNLALTYKNMGSPILAKNYELEEARLNQQVAEARNAASAAP